MCVVSMVGDHYSDKWKDLFPYLPKSNEPFTGPFHYPQPRFSEVSKQQFDELKKEVEDLKELLKRAKAYDEANNEPNCEMEDKIKFLREVAKFVGVDLDEIFKPKENG